MHLLLAKRGGGSTTDHRTGAQTAALAESLGDEHSGPRPAEVRMGDAEVIVLSSASVGAPQPADITFAARFRSNPALGPIVFHEDPTAPVSEEDWASDLRP